MSTKLAFDQLPSLPEILVNILDAIHSESTDFQQIADIIRHDPAISARLLEIANSSFYGRRNNSCTTVERALMLLGTDSVKAIVITSATKQFFTNFGLPEAQLKQLWQQALINAGFSHVLATLTNYHFPDEAYLCGLMANIGQLVLLTEHPISYLAILESADSRSALLASEQQQFGTTHPQIGAQYIERCGLDSFMADAICYHNEDSKAIQDAHHLVKIVNLASRLRPNGDMPDSTLAASNQLFGLNEALTRELANRIKTEVGKLAEAFGVDFDSNHNPVAAQRALGQRLSDISQVTHSRVGLQTAGGLQPLLAAIRRSLFLTLGAEHSLLFMFDREQQSLSTQAEQFSDQPALTIRAQANCSCVADALLSGNICLINASKALSVIDKQLLNYCRSNYALCIPLENSGSPLAVIVLALNENSNANLAERKTLLATLRQDLSQHLAQHLSAHATATTNNDQQRIREAVHEASNPLSIIRNYLEMLSIKLGEEHEASNNIALIKEEIDRVGSILLRLSNPDTEPANTTSETDINLLLNEIGDIFKKSLCLTHNIELQLKLDPTIGKLKQNGDHLRQIITNLVKNACEALPDKDGKITVATEADICLNGQHYVVISVEDNGPGIAPDIQQQLFQPVTSSKGGNHSGLGLSIVKQLIDEMNGSIVCRSRTTKTEGAFGTQFQILLPK